MGSYYSVYARCVYCVYLYAVGSVYMQFICAVCMCSVYNIGRMGSAHVVYICSR